MKDPFDRSRVTYVKVNGANEYTVFLDGVATDVEIITKGGRNGFGVRRNASVVWVGPLSDAKRLAWLKVTCC